MTRYGLREIQQPIRRYGIWDSVELTWYVGDHADAYYGAGVPMWRLRKEAQRVLDGLS